ncbi:MAG: hypothetical protein ACKOYK_03500 [Cyanobium sp.]
MKPVLLGLTLAIGFAFPAQALNQAQQENEIRQAVQEADPSGKLIAGLFMSE